jgi:hypothetical protein
MQDHSVNDHNDPAEPTFGELLRRHMDAIGVSSERLAQRIAPGMKRQTIDSWRNGGGSPFGRGDGAPQLDELVQALWDLDRDRIRAELATGATAFDRRFTVRDEIRLRDAAHRHHAPHAAAYYESQIAHLEADLDAAHEALAESRAAGLDGPVRWLVDALMATGKPDLYQSVAARHDDDREAVLRALATARPEVVAALAAVARVAG